MVDDDTIVEERDELMVSPNGDRTLRKAHFLKPSCPDTVPLIPLSPSLPSSDQSKWHLKGWRNPYLKWNDWVNRMKSIHHCTWRKAGIYEAILSSTYCIKRNDALVFGVAERWCPETNTFLFPWGEVTITLEDVMILMGYSVSGESILLPLQTAELKEIETKLVQKRIEIGRSKAKKACQYSWLKIFMETETELEHEAFLVMWLSRFVFPDTHDLVTKCVFPLAIRLARGIRIALAPAVLAAVYRDLSMLKSNIVTLCQLDSCKNRDSLTTFCLPFRLVQIWVWERFSKLRPCPNSIRIDEPRVARWCKVKVVRAGNVRLLLDLSDKSFQWRLCHTIINGRYFPKFYGDVDMWVSIDHNSSEELESFARFLRVSELAGFDCVEQYNPNRVARQFGIDQDVPSSVVGCNSSPKLAWERYKNPILDLKLYIPSRYFKAEVTSRYFEWWNKSVVIPYNADRSFFFQRRSMGCKVEKANNEASVPPGFSPKRRRVQDSDYITEDNPIIVDLSISSDTSGMCLKSACADDKNPSQIVYDEGDSSLQVMNPDDTVPSESGSSLQVISASLNSSEEKQHTDASVHPDFPAKCNEVESENQDENSIANSGNSRGHGKHDNIKLGRVCDSAHSPGVNELNKLIEPVVKVMHDKVEMTGSGCVVGDSENPVNISQSKEGSEENGLTGADKEWSKLLARITRLEVLFAEEKARISRLPKQGKYSNSDMRI